jgi:hypothetical protein
LNNDGNNDIRQGVIIDEAAAECLIAVLEAPAREIPDIGEYMTQGEEDGTWFLKDLTGLSGAGKKRR